MNLCEYCSQLKDGHRGYGATTTSRLVALGFMLLNFAIQLWFLLHHKVKEEMWWVKVFAAGSMCLFVLFTRPTIQAIGDDNLHKKEVLHFNLMIALGLFFCGMGDLNIGTVFLLGVAGYFLGHLCLIAGMLRRIRLLSSIQKPSPRFYAIVMGLYVGIYLIMLYSHMDKPGLELALSIYAVTIGSMVLTAMTLGNQEKNVREKVLNYLGSVSFIDEKIKGYLEHEAFVLKGSNSMGHFYLVAAVSFIASDSTLGIVLFVNHHVKWLAFQMLTYWTALAFLGYAGTADLPCVQCLSQVVAVDESQERLTGSSYEGSRAVNQVV